MKTLAQQFILSVLLAVLSVSLEFWTGSLKVRDFINDNGLILISALFAINVATLAAIMPILRELEGAANRFPETRNAALNGIKEMFLMGIVFYILLILAPDKYWCVCTTNKSLFDILLSWSVSIFARATIFHSVYATYDFSRALIKISSAHTKRPY